jgi:hypothetical protein
MVNCLNIQQCGGLVVNLFSYSQDTKALVFSIFTIASILRTYVRTAFPTILLHRWYANACMHISVIRQCTKYLHPTKYLYEQPMHPIDR